jgi:hypothetical protein
MDAQANVTTERQQRDWRVCDHPLVARVSDGDVIICGGCGQKVWVKDLGQGFACLYVTEDRA